MNKLYRTMMMTPGNARGMIEKASRALSDACTLDLEDGVHAGHKEEAREITAELLASLDWGPRSRGVRINHITTPDGEADIRTVVRGNPDYIVLPKVESGDEVVKADKMLRELGADDTVLWCMIEACKGVQYVDEIATASDRMAALIFGGGDFSADVGLKRNGLNKNSPIAHEGRQIELLYARSRVVTSAHAHGLLAIDSPCLDVHDEAETYRSAIYSFQFGYDGVNILAPRQSPQVHRAFYPEQEDVEWAQGVLKEFESAGESGATVTTHAGEMVDGPFVRSARSIMERVENVASWEQLFG